MENDKTGVHITFINYKCIIPESLWNEAVKKMNYADSRLMIVKYNALHGLFFAPREY